MALNQAQEEGEREEMVDRAHSWDSSNEGYPSGPLSEEVPILSNRGLSQLLPSQVQSELEQHIIIQSSSNSELGTEEIELQTQVIDVEACDLEPEQVQQEQEEQQVEQEPEFEEQVPEEAVEVIIWSSVDETLANQEIINYGSSEMINQSSSEEGVCNSVRYKVKKHAVVISREGDNSSRELFSQGEVSSFSKPVQSEVIRTSGAMATICSVDVIVSPSLIVGSSISLFSTPSGQQRAEQQQAEQQQNVELREEEKEVPESPLEQVSAPTSLPTGLDGVAPHRPFFSFPSILTNLGDFVKSAVWFKAPRKNTGRDLEVPLTAMVESDTDAEMVIVYGQDSRTTVSSSTRGSDLEVPPAAMTESDTDAELVIVSGKDSRTTESSASETEDHTEMEVVEEKVEVVVEENKETDVETMDSEMMKGEDGVTEEGGSNVAANTMEEAGSDEDKENAEEMDVVEGSLGTEPVDVEGSWSPRELVIVQESPKDSTGNITMGTPHYSQPPFQPVTSVEETRGMQQGNVRETEQLGGEEPQHGGVEQQVRGVEHHVVEAEHHVMEAEHHVVEEEQVKGLEEEEVHAQEEEPGVQGEEEEEEKEEERRNPEEMEEELRSMEEEEEEEEEKGTKDEEEEEEEEDLGCEHEDIEDSGVEPVEVGLEDEILNQDSQDTVITAAATTTTTIITAKTSVTSASHSTKQKTNQMQKSHLNMSHSSLHALPFPPFSSHSSPLSSSSSSSSSLPHLSRVSNTPREIASIIHATYMSTALHNSRFTTPTLTDLWKHKSSSVSLQSSFESNA